MSSINCEINLILTWSEDFFVSSATWATQFKIDDTKLYVLVVVLSTQDNVKLLQQLKSGFKRIINWNKFQSKVSIDRKNPHLDYLIDPKYENIRKIATGEGGEYTTGCLLGYPFFQGTLEFNRNGSK